MTSTRSSGPTSARRNACNVIAIGSARAATLVGSESGIRIRPSAADRLVLAERAAVADEVGRGTVEAHRRATPPAGSADAASRRWIPHHSVAGQTSRSRSAQRRRRPTIRDREWHPAWRTSPGPCADRSRRSRTPRSRRAPRRAPARVAAPPRPRSCRRPRRRLLASTRSARRHIKCVFRPILSREERRVQSWAPCTMSGTSVTART